jgi:hypothetical protein
MKKLPEPIKPDVATYNIAKRMETAGLLRKGQALMLAATAGLSKANAAAKKESDAKLYDRNVFRVKVAVPNKRGTK